MKTLSDAEFNTLLNNTPDCFFINVGANDGKQFDPLYNLAINNKWAGILIEPDTQSFQQLQLNYNNSSTLLFENSAIADIDGSVDLYCGKTNLHFTLSANQAEYMFDVPPTIVKVPSITFKTLLKKYDVSKIDILMIDVEGYDLKLLKTFPFEQIKPTIVRCEYIHIWNENDTLENMVEFLTGHGYECYVDEANTDVIAIQNNVKKSTHRKPRIRVYNPINKDIQRPVNYTLFWNRLIHRLSYTFDVEEHREYTEPSRQSIHLQKGTGPNFLYECDFAIENLDNGEFCILSLADVLHANIVHEQYNPYLKKVLFAQYEYEHFTKNVKTENMHKYSPWMYFQADSTDLDFFYYKRKYNNTNLKQKLYFRGETRSRPILNYFSPNILSNFDKIDAPSTSYFDEAIQHKVALSIGGVGEFCYRDVEYMAMGIPFIRFEYKNQMNTRLVPNVHYVSIPTTDDLLFDRDGNRKHALLLEQRYLEVVNDDNFLEFVGSNAREYYETHLQYPNNLTNTINLLGIDDWSLT